MSGLSPRELKRFRNLLKQRQLDLENVCKTGEQSAEIVELDQTRVGRISRMDAMQAQAMSQETNRRRVIELQRIKAAFKRMDDGEYGYCVSCSIEIVQARLELDPATPLCMDCAVQVNGG